MTWTADRPTALTPRDELALLPAYSAALSSAVPVTIRASSNEAPDGLSDAVRRAVLDRLEHANRYPVLGGRDVAVAIAEHLGADPAEIAAADGSLSLLNYLLLTYCRPGSRVVHAWRSYEAYPICIRTAGAEPVGVPNDADGGHDLDAMAAAIDDSTAAVTLCSPNNPTGNVLHHDDVVRFLERVPANVLVVLDEAYHDFVTDPEAVRSRELLAAYANLVVLRTFSKAHALAGLRVGHMIAQPDVVTAVRTLLPPFAVGALGAVAAIAALGDEEHRRRVVDGVVRQRAEVVRLLDERGIPHTRSEANFVWMPLGAASAGLGAACAAVGMSTRVFSDEGIRISLGEPALPSALALAIDVWRDATGRTDADSADRTVQPDPSGVSAV
jgi:histidinol-phosphate aminotransferase